MEMLTGALVGTGSIARTLHMPAHQTLSRSTLKWVCGSSMETAERFAKEYGIPRWTNQLDDVLADPEVDWVDIAAPNRMHEPMTVRTLQAGKHVMCQKPMALSVDSGRRMIEAARQSARQLAMFMCFRTDPAILLLKELIDAGGFGKIIYFRGKMISANGHTLKPGQWRMEEASGALDLLGVHMIDLFFWLSGGIEWVQSYSDTLYAPMSGDDISLAIYGMKDGVTAVMETTYCAYVNADTPLYFFELNGTQGMAGYQLETGDLTLQMQHDYDSPSFTYKAGELAKHKFDSYLIKTGTHQAFVDAILAGEPFGIDGTLGLKALQIMEATRRGANEGKRISVVY